MAQHPVVTVDDMTALAFAPHRRPGCDRGLMHQDAVVQAAVFRVEPGSGVSRHLHSRISDYFLGVRGVLEIRYESVHGNGIFELKPGAFCTLPPGVRHEVFNPSTTDIAFFLLMQAPCAGYDYVPVEFRQLQAMLD